MSTIVAFQPGHSLLISIGDSAIFQYFSDVFAEHLVCGAAQTRIIPGKAHQFGGSDKEVSSSFDIPEQVTRRIFARRQWTGFVLIKGSGVFDTRLCQLGKFGIAPDFPNG